MCSRQNHKFKIWNFLHTLRSFHHCGAVPPIRFYQRHAITDHRKREYLQTAEWREFYTPASLWAKSERPCHHPMLMRILVPICRPGDHQDCCYYCTQELSCSLQIDQRNERGMSGNWRLYRDIRFEMFKQRVINLMIRDRMSFCSNFTRFDSD